MNKFEWLMDAIIIPSFIISGFAVCTIWVFLKIVCGIISLFLS